MAELALNETSKTSSGDTSQLFVSSGLDTVIDIENLEGEKLLQGVLMLAQREPARWGQYANRVNNFLDSVVTGNYSLAYSIATRHEPGVIPFACDLEDYAVRNFCGLKTDLELIRGRMTMDRFAMRSAVNRELQSAGLKAGIVRTLTKYLRRDPPAYDGAYFTAKDGCLTAPLVEGTAKLYFSSIQR